MLISGSTSLPPSLRCTVYAQRCVSPQFMSFGIRPRTYHKYYVEEMNKETEAICGELDDLAVSMLDLMKQYIDLKMTLENSVKTGSLHLAKSRYIMGNKCVSVLQLPTEDSELNALTKVVGNEEDDELRLKLSKISLSHEPEPAKEPDDGLKRRKFKKGENEEETEEEPPKRSPRRAEVMQDPLKWFGVLVPQNMRLAQSSFDAAIETSIEIANVQLEMLSLKRKYGDLLDKKKLLSGGDRVEVET